MLFSLTDDTVMQTVLGPVDTLRMFIIRMDMVKLALISCKMYTLLITAHIVDVILEHKHLPRPELRKLVVAEMQKHHVSLRPEATVNLLASFKNFTHGMVQGFWFFLM